MQVIDSLSTSALMTTPWFSSGPGGASKHHHQAPDWLMIFLAWPIIAVSSLVFSQLFPFAQPPQLQPKFKMGKVRKVKIKLRE